MASKKTERAEVPGGDLEPFTARLTAEAKRKLQALAQIRAQPAYEVIEKAFWSLWKSFPSGEREGTERLIELVDEARQNRE